MYITYDQYVKLYKPVENFELLQFEACRYLDKYTTGIDGVKKLKIAFPTDEDSAASVRHCAAQIIYALSQIQSAENAASLTRGYEKTENGLKGKVISSVSAGNESISYSASGSQNTAIDAAAADVSAKNNLIRRTIREYLSGVCDANGVNLLYTGVYPRV